MATSSYPAAWSSPTVVVENVDLDHIRSRRMRSRLHPSIVIALRAGDAALAELLVNAHVEFGPDGLIHRFRTYFDAASITERGRAAR